MEAGFQVDKNGDLLQHLLERCGGHFVDQGKATSLIASKKVGIKSGIYPTSYTSTGLQLNDGTMLSADAIIWCTGYADKNVKEVASSIFGNSGDVDIANKMDATWQLDREGEIRGLWKRQKYIENFWLMGGFTSQQRYHSKFLALQIKAVLEGVLPEAYRETP